MTVYFEIIGFDREGNFHASKVECPTLESAIEQHKNFIRMEGVYDYKVTFQH